MQTNTFLVEIENIPITISYGFETGKPNSIELTKVIIGGYNCIDIIGDFTGDHIELLCVEHFNKIYRKQNEI